MDRSRDETTVTATFHDRDRVVDAVEALAHNSVPPNDIDVVLVDEDGLHRREVHVRHEMETLRGLGAGLAIGALIGAPLFLLIALGVFGSIEVELLSSNAAVATLQGAAIGAASGAPLGALLGLVRWNARLKISHDEVENGAVLVSVHSDALAGRATRLFREAGADHISE